MDYKTLGNTGLLVSRLCLGTMTFGDGNGVYRHIGKSDQTDADTLVRTAFDAGVNFFDTADVYSAGASEKILGRSIARTS
jgi:aryl-alcohol dehydrogenase-like predicted oxidoreductase